MAKAAAKAALKASVQSSSGAKGSARGGAKGGAKGGKVLMVLAAIIALAIVAAPTALVFAVGLLPTIVALLVERDAGRYGAISVGSMNFCGVFPSAIALWRDGHTVQDALNTIANPYDLAVMFGAAGVGWLLYFGLPPLVGSLLVQKHEAEIRRIESQQSALQEEWGPDINNAAPPPSVS